VVYEFLCLETVDFRSPSLLSGKTGIDEPREMTGSDLRLKKR